ncbi:MULTISPECIES: ABC transporter substrate-binding protein [unclassified Oceanispirochaeta]|uniref:ABC transporter substrate-binding protein n=1 Tax=unclassified Oceanispirochaeta TaxID=2635722 RepID=UPI001315011C|nr:MULTISPECIES: extracellular solute-binding protein [unclassified Oceanispirochaeta]MBF9013993.1 extracellular solute-binding protein [Oceanispirochaeta sp. M2]NPD70484.1 extracellular solute-binding protein [Oceanispirochaeta sp. M1]
MKKGNFVLLVLLATLIGFTGCSKEKTAAASEDSGKVEGNLIVWSWDVALAHLEEVAPGFQELYPDVKFNFEEMGTTQIYGKMTTSLASGIGLPDLVSLEGEQMSKFGSKFPDKFLDLTSHVNPSDFLPVKIGEATSGGKIIAYPWDAGPCGLYYRSDIFEQGGIHAEDIKTWDDFITAGIALKEKTGVAMMPLATSRKDTFYRLLLMQLDSFYFDDAGNTRVNSAESIRAMEMVKKIYDADITVNDGSWDDYIISIKEGLVATVPEAVWLIGSIKDAAPDTAGLWRIMPLPGFDENNRNGSSNGGSVLAIPAVTKSPDAAIAFAEYAMTDQAGLIQGFKNYGLYPSYIPVYQADIFQQGDEFFGGQKIYSMFGEIGKSIPAVNYTQNFAETLDLSKNAVAKVLLKGADVTQTMNDLQNELSAKFDK